MNPLDYYISLLPSQWIIQPNFVKWLSANLQLFQDVNACLESFATAFTLTPSGPPVLVTSSNATISSSSTTITVTSPNAITIGQLVTGQFIPANCYVSSITGTTVVLTQTPTASGTFPLQFYTVGAAIGSQLDVLGLIIGQSRTVGFQPSGGVSPVLDDTSYRLLLQAKVAANHWNGQIDTLIRIWQNLFPGGLIIVNDEQNMTVQIFVGGAFTSIVIDLILNGYVIPRPQAVQYLISFANLPIFGCDRNDAYVAGADRGFVV